MKKKDLLAIKQLKATPSMHKTAKENPVKKATVTLKTMYSSYKREEWTSKYFRYFRATVWQGILKVAIFTQRSLECGADTPDYEVYCDKDNDSYITYEPKMEKWRSAKIDYLQYNMPHIYQTLNWQQDADRKLVNDYFGTGQNKDIYAAVLDFQANIGQERLHRKHRSELEEIDEVMREVPDIPKNFHEWIVKNCFRETMFYEPDSACRGKWPKMYCTHCHQWMDTQSYPNRPEHNKEGKCPKCGVNITYKSWNKQKYVNDDVDICLLQRLKDDSGWIMRKFDCRIKRNHEKGWEEYKLFVREEERAKLDDAFREREFFEYGEYKYTGVVRWCHEIRRSPYTYYSCEIGVGMMYTPNLKRELKREQFGKMDLKKIMKGGERERVDPVYILGKLHQHPYLEYMQKSGLNTLLQEIMSNREDRSLFDATQSRIHDVVKLDKQRFRRLQKLDGGSRTLLALQYERTTGKKVSDHNMEFLEANRVDVPEVIEISEKTGMNLQRTLNYLERQMQTTGQNFNTLFRHYTDYLDMAEVFGMDITDEIVCRQPRMMEFHDRYVERKNRPKNKIRDKTVDQKYPNIRQNKAKFKKHFAFQTEELEIAVPETASDITKEGRKQHHCVGVSDTYIKSMNDEKTFILFLRKKTNLKQPYYTLEVTWDGEIEQFYAAYDRQPDKEQIEAVLKKFTEAVRKREMESRAKMDEAKIRGAAKAAKIDTQYEMIPAAVV